MRSERSCADFAWHSLLQIRVFFSNLLFSIKNSALFTDTTYDSMRLARSRLLVRRLLTETPRVSDDTAIVDRLMSYSYLASWADRSEVFGSVQAVGSSRLVQHCCPLGTDRVCSDCVMRI
jgi:hypothetical protein